MAPTKSTIAPDSAPMKLPFLYQENRYTPVQSENNCQSINNGSDPRINDLIKQLASNTPAITGYVSQYSGHQFGTFNPALGDGRALTLAQSFDGNELQLKGSGPTPFSYGNDGRLSLKNALSEYINCTILSALKVPTVAALGLYRSSDRLQHQGMQKAAVLIRSAPSFLRIGHLEHLFLGNNHEAIQLVIDYCLAKQFPTQTSRLTENKTQLFLADVIERSALLVASWQANGFYHGTLNSDNFSLFGLTLDCNNSRFLSHYDPLFCTNPIDDKRRYAFTHQPRVTLFNLQVLAQTLSGLLDNKTRQQCLAQFTPRYHFHFARKLGQKLALSDSLINRQSKQQQLLQRRQDSQLLSDFLQLTYQLGIEYWRMFTLLTNTPPGPDGLNSADLTASILQYSKKHLNKADISQLTHWLACYQQRLALQSAAKAPQQGDNQLIENWHEYYQLALSAAQRDDFSPLKALLGQIDSHQ